LISGFLDPSFDSDPSKETLDTEAAHVVPFAMASFSEVQRPCAEQVWSEIAARGFHALSSKELHDLENAFLGEYYTGQIPSWVRDIQNARERRSLAGSESPRSNIPAPAGIIDVTQEVSAPGVKAGVEEEAEAQEEEHADAQKEEPLLREG
jgi:hypothetical protein